jgi:hypothetical protein
MFEFSETARTGQGKVFNYHTDQPNYPLQEGNDVKYLANYQYIKHYMKNLLIFLRRTISCASYRWNAQQISSTEYEIRFDILGKIWKRSTWS